MNKLITVLDNAPPVYSPSVFIQEEQNSVSSAPPSLFIPLYLFRENSVGQFPFFLFSFCIYSGRTVLDSAPPVYSPSVFIQGEQCWTVSLLFILLLYLFRENSVGQFLPVYSPSVFIQGEQCWTVSLLFILLLYIFRENSVGQCPSCLFSFCIYLGRTVLDSFPPVYSPSVFIQGEQCWTVPFLFILLLYLLSGNLPRG